MDDAFYVDYNLFGNYPMRHIAILAACISAFLGCQPAKSAEVEGGIIVRIPDEDQSRCINMQTDAVTFHLIRAVETKHSGWIQEDKTIGMYIETTLEGATGSSTKRVTFPRAFMIDVLAYGGGAVNLPVEERLLSQFQLTNSGNSYSSAKFTIKLAKIQDEGPAATALSILADVTKQLPIPANPLSSGFEFFVDLSNKLVSNYIDKDISADSAPKAQISFEFSPNGDCTGDLETTGALAIIFKGTGAEAIDIGNEDGLCFRYSGSPTKSIKSAQRTHGKCPTELSKYTQISNPHYLFLLISTKKQASPEKVVQYSWGYGKSKYKYFLPQTEFSDADVATAVKAWQQQLGPVDAGNDPVIGAVKGLIVDDASLDLSTVGIKQTWDFGSVDDTIAGIAGVDQQAYGTTIDQQVISNTEAIALDIASSVKRCKAFDISIEDCF